MAKSGKKSKKVKSLPARGLTSKQSKGVKGGIEIQKTGKSSTAEITVRRGAVNAF